MIVDIQVTIEFLTPCMQVPIWGQDILRHAFIWLDTVAAPSLIWTVPDDRQQQHRQLQQQQRRRQQQHWDWLKLILIPWKEVFHRTARFTIR